MTSFSTSDERVLILAPIGRDAQLAEATLEAVGLKTLICFTFSELSDAIHAGAGAALIASEALNQEAIIRLAALIDRQPPWSDLPLIILTTGGTATRERGKHLRDLDILRNATLLERPLRQGTLANAVMVALQSRRRQYELRDHLVERTRLEHELEEAYKRHYQIAETLQRSLLSKPASDAFSGIEIDTVYQPARDEADVGGDFYDIVALNDNSIALIVGDVSGKGLEAASRTMQAKYGLRAYLRESGSPLEAISKLNSLLLDEQRFDPEPPSGFVCISVAVINTETGATRIASAGSEAPLVILGDGRLNAIDLQGPPVGVLDEVHFQHEEIELHLGDTLLMITDGITEARRDHEFFGYDGLLRAASTLNGESHPTRVVSAILDHAVEYSGGHLADDVCMLAARRVRN